MTKLLEEAISLMRNLPEKMQDLAARQLIRHFHFEEEATAEEIEAIEEGRRAVQRGDFVTLDQLRHDMGLGNR